jgi:hypothetical protein
MRGLSQLFSNIKLSFDHTSHSYVFNLTNIKHVYSILALGQTFYKLKVKIGKVERQGVKKRDYSDFLNYSLSKASLSILEELEIWIMSKCQEA